MNHLTASFARAGLDLRLASNPFNLVSDRFALDIRRSRPRDVRSEHFLAWLGANANGAANDVQVAGLDRDERQLVLFVRQPRRHLLVGRDERQLFMCELPKPCTSVKQAHDVLRPKFLREATVRQGEWFFVPATPWEVSNVSRALRGNHTVVRKSTAINHFIPRAGKPHVVDELVPFGGVFARGSVRHPDHKTIWLRDWHRVVKNLEVVPEGTVLGGTWID